MANRSTQVSHASGPARLRVSGPMKLKNMLKPILLGTVTIDHHNSRSLQTNQGESNRHEKNNSKRHGPWRFITRANSIGDSDTRMVSAVAKGIVHSLVVAFWPAMGFSRFIRFFSLSMPLLINDVPGVGTVQCRGGSSVPLLRSADKNGPISSRS